MDGKLKRKLVVAAVAVGAIAVTGAAVAATRDTNPRQQSQAVVNDAARQLGVQPSELTAALRKALANRVDEAVRDGRLTKAEGDALKARINSGEVPLFGGPHRGVGKFGPGPHFHLHSLEAAASYLGLTRAQLHTQLNSGKTLAQVARDRDKSVDGLIDALVAEKTKRLDEAVEDGRLEDAQRDRIVADLRERVTELVNGRLPARPGRLFRDPRPFGREPLLPPREDASFGGRPILPPVA
jgi:polyhydroxyalkanoate synthesis regulator phasin